MDAALAPGRLYDKDLKALSAAALSCNLNNLPTHKQKLRLVVQIGAAHKLELTQPQKEVKQALQQPTYNS